MPLGGHDPTAILLTPYDRERPFFGWIMEWQGSQRRATGRIERQPAKHGIIGDQRVTRREQLGDPAELSRALAIAPQSPQKPTITPEHPDVGTGKVDSRNLS